MNKIFSIYEQIIIKEVVYELGDNYVTAQCDVTINRKNFSTTMMISHTDLNRIISKISAMGYEFKTENVCKMKIDEYTEILEYRFENVFGENIVLENFEFTNTVKEIRA